MQYHQKDIQMNILFSKVGELYLELAYDQLIELFLIIIGELKKIDVSQDIINEKKIKINTCLLQFRKLKMLTSTITEQGLLAEASSTLFETTANTYLWLKEIEMSKN